MTYLNWTRRRSSSRLLALSQTLPNLLLDDHKDPYNVNRNALIEFSPCTLLAPWASERWRQVPTGVLATPECPAVSLRRQPIDLCKNNTKQPHRGPQAARGCTQGTSARLYLIISTVNRSYECSRGSVSVSASPVRYENDSAAFQGAIRSRAPVSFITNTAPARLMNPGGRHEDVTCWFCRGSWAIKVGVASKLISRARTQGRPIMRRESGDRHLSLHLSLQLSLSTNQDRAD